MVDLQYRVTRSAILHNYFQRHELEYAKTAPNTFCYLHVSTILSNKNFILTWLRYLCLYCLCLGLTKLLYFFIRDPNVPLDTGEFEEWPRYTLPDQGYKILTPAMENGRALRMDACAFWLHYVPTLYNQGTLIYLTWTICNNDTDPPPPPVIETWNWYAHTFT